MLRWEKGEKIQRPSTASFFSELAGGVEENLRSLPDKNYKLINEKC